VTVVDICNLALGWLGVEPIIALTDGTKRALLCTQNWALIRDAVLEERDWAFASVWTGMEVEGDAPVNPSYPYMVSAPPYSLAVREVVDASGTPIEWKLDEGFVLLERADTVVDGESAEVTGAYVRATTQVLEAEGTGVFTAPNNYVEAVAHRLAAVLATALTENQSVAREQLQLYAMCLAKAKIVDSMQGRSQLIQASRLASARRA
jgi:hypothetical protein